MTSRSCELVERAYLELLWDSLDADAKDIRVSISVNAVGGIEEVRVVDDGTGMTPEGASEAFEHLGGSWKARQDRSPGNRPLHGKAWPRAVAGIRDRQLGSMGDGGTGQRHNGDTKTRTQGASRKPPSRYIEAHRLEASGSSKDAQAGQPHLSELHGESAGADRGCYAA